MSQVCSHLIECGCKQTCTGRCKCERNDLNCTDKEDMCTVIYRVSKFVGSSFGYILNVCILFLSMVLAYINNKILCKFAINVEI